MNTSTRHCLRCNTSWESRLKSRPKQCPNCKQTRWDTPAWSGKIAKEAAKKRWGSPATGEQE